MILFIFEYRSKILISNILLYLIIKKYQILSLYFILYRNIKLAPFFIKKKLCTLFYKNKVFNILLFITYSIWAYIFINKKVLNIFHSLIKSYKVLPSWYIMKLLMDNIKFLFIKNNAELSNPNFFNNLTYWFFHSPQI